MELVWLQDFLALVEHKNFSRAAEARHVTQPAFSRRIRAVEQWVGTPLFDRRTHALRLTPAGESFRPAAEEAFRRLLEGREAAREDGGLREPTLRFAATHSLALTFFSNWVHSLAKQMGQMAKLQLFSDTMPACEHMIITGDCQFFLCHYHPSMHTDMHNNQFVSASVGHDELIAVSAPDHRGKPLFALPGEEASPVMALTFGERSGFGRILTAALQTKAGLWLKPTFTSHMASVLAAVARDGKGVTWLPRSLIEHDLSAGSLVRAGDTDWDVPLEIRLFRPRSRQNLPAEKFWQVVVRANEESNLPKNLALAPKRKSNRR